MDALNLWFSTFSRLPKKQNITQFDYPFNTIIVLIHLQVLVTQKWVAAAAVEKHCLKL